MDFPHAQQALIRKGLRQGKADQALALISAKRIAALQQNLVPFTIFGLEIAKKSALVRAC